MAREQEEPLTPDAYDETRARLAALNRLRGGLLARLLPTSNQLVHYAGSWEAALDIAELPKPAPVPARPAVRAEQHKGVPVVEAIGIYLQHQGQLPSRERLRAFFAEAGAPLSDIATKPWTEFLSDFWQKWTRLGRWCPPGYPKRGQLARYPLPADGISGLPKHVPGRWEDLDECALVLLSYWERCEVTRSRSRSPTAAGPWVMPTAPRPAASNSTAASLR